MTATKLSAVQLSQEAVGGFPMTAGNTKGVISMMTARSEKLSGAAMNDTLNEFAQGGLVLGQGHIAPIQHYLTGGMQTGTRPNRSVLNNLSAAAASGETQKPIMPQRKMALSFHPDTQKL